MKHKSIADFIKDADEKITVGSIEIRVLCDGSFYMERIKGKDEGEGIQIPRRIFVEMIEQFYKESF